MIATTFLKNVLLLLIVTSSCSLVFLNSCAEAKNEEGGRKTTTTGLNLLLRDTPTQHHYEWDAAHRSIMSWEFQMLLQGFPLHSYPVYQSRIQWTLENLQNWNSSLGVQFQLQTASSYASVSEYTHYKIHGSDPKAIVKLESYKETSRDSGPNEQPSSPSAGGSDLTLKWGDIDANFAPPKNVRSDIDIKMEEDVHCEYFKYGLSLVKSTNNTDKYTLNNISDLSKIFASDLASFMGQHDSTLVEETSSYRIVRTRYACSLILPSSGRVVPCSTSMMLEENTDGHKNSYKNEFSIRVERNDVAQSSTSGRDLEEALSIVQQVMKVLTAGHDTGLGSAACHRS